MDADEITDVVALTIEETDADWKSVRSLWMRNRYVTRGQLSRNHTSVIVISNSRLLFQPKQSNHRLLRSNWLKNNHQSSHNCQCDYDFIRSA